MLWSYTQCDSQLKNIPCSAAHTTSSMGLTESVINPEPDLQVTGMRLILPKAFWVHWCCTDAPQSQSDQMEKGNSWHGERVVFMMSSFHKQFQTFYGLLGLYWLYQIRDDLFHKILFQVFVTKTIAGCGFVWRPDLVFFFKDLARKYAIII